MGPGPRFEPESQDPQSHRMTAYPTPAFFLIIFFLINAGAGIRTLVDLCQQVLSLSPLAARAPPLRIRREQYPQNHIFLINISNNKLKKLYYRKVLRPGFEPESSPRKGKMIGRTTLPKQKNKQLIKIVGPMGFEPMAARL